MNSDTILSLQNLGLTDKEALVYNALLQVKRGTALSVAEAAGIKRPTAYSVLDSLKKKKLVAVTKFRGVKDYRAMPLEHLKHFIREQRRLAEVSLPAIQKLYNNRAYKARLRVYQTVSDVKLLFEKSLREKSPVSILGSSAVFEKELGSYWQFYLKRTQQLGIPPQFKNYVGAVALLLWSDKVVFVEFGEKLQVVAFKNKELHDFYFNIWTNY